MKHRGRIEQTPWWLTIWGYPPYRRWVLRWHLGCAWGEWEYLS